jgi:hypothetical protein
VAGHTGFEPANPAAGYLIEILGCSNIQEKADECLAVYFIVRHQMRRYSFDVARVLGNDFPRSRYPCTS